MLLKKKLNIELKITKNNNYKFFFMEKKFLRKFPELKKTKFQKEKLFKYIDSLNRKINQNIVHQALHLKGKYINFANEIERMENLQKKIKNDAEELKIHLTEKYAIPNLELDLNKFFNFSQNLLNKFEELGKKEFNQMYLIDKLKEEWKEKSVNLKKITQENLKLALEIEKYKFSYKKIEKESLNYNSNSIVSLTEPSIQKNFEIFDPNNIFLTNSEGSKNSGDLYKEINKFHKENIILRKVFQSNLNKFYKRKETFKVFLTELSNGLENSIINLENKKIRQQSFENNTRNQEKHAKLLVERVLQGMNNFKSKMNFKTEEIKLESFKNLSASEIIQLTAIHNIDISKIFNSNNLKQFQRLKNIVKVYNQSSTLYDLPSFLLFSKNNNG